MLLFLSKQFPYLLLTKSNATWQRLPLEEYTLVCVAQQVSLQHNWYDEIADLYEFTDLYLYLKSKRSARKPKIKSIKHLNGSISFLKHQLIHFSQYGR